jgi:hypothetical protein
VSGLPPNPSVKWIEFSAKQASDSGTLALATANLSEILAYLRTCPVPPQRDRPGMTI